jgi:ABC-2 type transport system ATP-binding protein
VPENAPTDRGPRDFPGVPAVECRELLVRYGKTIAVDGLTLRASAGEVLALLGPNGAGKTSTVECFEGYRRSDGGTVRVLGHDPVADHHRIVRSIGVMLQRGGVYPMLGPRQVLELFASYYDHPEAPEDLLALVGLGGVARTPWQHLSGGEQQRLSLALAVIGRPEVVFLDEPTAGVDPEGRLRIRSVVHDLASRGTCVLLTTHELAEAEQMADRVAIIRQGRSVAAGTLAELAAGVGGARGDTGAGTTKLRFGAPNGLDVAGLSTTLGAPVVEVSAGRYEVAAPATPRLTATLTGWLAEHDAALSDLQTGRTLEEVYLALVGGDTADAPVDGHRSGPQKGRRGNRSGRPERGARHRAKRARQAPRS